MRGDCPTPCSPSRQDTGVGERDVWSSCKHPVIAGSTATAMLPNTVAMSRTCLGALEMGLVLQV